MIRRPPRSTPVPYTTLFRSVHRDIKKVYQEQFGKAVEQYNTKQKRKDRRITDYYRKIKSSKNQATQREFIVQVGNQNNYLKQDRTTSKNWQTAKKILTEFEHDCEQNNPNLQVYNAVIHMDEPGSPHLHQIGRQSCREREDYSGQDVR